MNADSAKVLAALALLGECLWDEEAWEPEDLIARMEQVYVTLGGDLSQPDSEEQG